jgi:hypothetical protein
MGDASSAILVGACAGVAVVSLALGYLAELVIPVQKQATPPPPPKEKTIEERVEILEKTTLPPPQTNASAPQETPTLRVVG